MKARIKATGEVCDVLSFFLDKENGRYGFFSLDEIEIIPDEQEKGNLKPISESLKEIEEARGRITVALAEENKFAQKIIEDVVVSFVGDQFCKMLSKMTGVNIEEIRGAMEKARVASELMKETISDGHGNTWSKKCDVCGNDMQVVRPGSAICVKCNDEILANDGMPEVFPKVRPTGLMTATEVVDMSKFDNAPIFGHLFSEKRNPVDRERDK